MKKNIIALCFILASQAVWAQDVEVKGLFKNGAVLIIDGKQRMLKAGKTSPEGVLLVEADSKKAIIEINGKRQELGLTRRMGGKYVESENAEVRLSPTHGNHYFAVGTINRKSAEMLVDTGATYIAISSAMADQMGLNYRSGEKVRLGTANGNVDGYKFSLHSVTVGTITVNQVDAVVLPGEHPQQILLGNSFLSKLDYRVEKGILVLKQKY